MLEGVVIRNTSVSKSMEEHGCLSKFELPCRHIFACREKSKIVYNEGLITNRWHKEFENQDGIESLYTVDTYSITNRNLVKKKKPQRL